LAFGLVVAVASIDHLGRDRVLGVDLLLLQVDILVTAFRRKLELVRVLRLELLLEGFLRRSGCSD
jgi:hypothetical protein